MVACTPKKSDSYGEKEGQIRSVSATCLIMNWYASIHKKVAAETD